MTNVETLLSDIAQSIPDSLGYINNTALPSGEARGAVICIQDLHAHIPVQREMAAIIEILARKHGFRLLCVEGASGAGDVSLLWSLPMRTRMAFCERLFEKGYLTGSEFATVAYPDLGLELYGVDVASLYRLNWKALRENLVGRPSITLVLLDFCRRLNFLYVPLVSPALLHFLQLRYPAGEGIETTFIWDEKDLVDLFEYARRHEIKLPPNLLSAYSQWKDQEAQSTVLMNSLIENARNLRVEAIIPVLNVINEAAPDLRERLEFAYKIGLRQEELPQMFQRILLSKHSVDVLAERMPAELLDKFRRADNYLHDRLAEIPNEVIQAHGLPKRPSLGDFLSDEEKDLLWYYVASSTCTTEVDRIVLQLQENLGNLLLFLRLRCPPDKARSFILRGREKVCQELENDIRRLNQIAESALGAQLIPLDPVIAAHAYWEYSETFYKVARQRSSSMADNAAAAMAKKEVDRAIIVSGGFHSQNISDRLVSSAQMAVVIITPDINMSSSSLIESEDRYIRRGVTEE